MACHLCYHCCSDLRTRPSRKKPSCRRPNCWSFNQPPAFWRPRLLQPFFTFFDIVWLLSRWFRCHSNQEPLIYIKMPSLLDESSSLSRGSLFPQCLRGYFLVNRSQFKRWDPQKRNLCFESFHLIYIYILIMFGNGCGTEFYTVEMFLGTFF